MVRAGKYQKESDGEKILELGRTYMRDAEKSEKDSDYIAAESIYQYFNGNESKQLKILVKWDNLIYTIKM